MKELLTSTDAQVATTGNLLCRREELQRITPPTVTVKASTIGDKLQKAKSVVRVLETRE